MFSSISFTIWVFLLICHQDFEECWWKDGICVKSVAPNNSSSSIFYIKKPGSFDGLVSLSVYNLVLFKGVGGVIFLAAVLLKTGS